MLSMLSALRLKSAIGESRDDEKERDRLGVGEKWKMLMYLAI